MTCWQTYCYFRSPIHPLKQHAIACNILKLRPHSIRKCLCWHEHFHPQFLMTVQRCARTSKTIANFLKELVYRVSKASVGFRNETKRNLLRPGSSVCTLDLPRVCLGPVRLCWSAGLLSLVLRKKSRTKATQACLIHTIDSSLRRAVGRPRGCLLPVESAAQTGLN